MGEVELRARSPTTLARHADRSGCAAPTTSSPGRARTRRPRPPATRAPRWRRRRRARAGPAALVAQRRSCRCLHSMHSVARGKCLEPHLADGVAARLAHPVGAVVDPGDRLLDEDEVVPRVPRHRHLVVALERVRAHVRLVVACPLAALAQQVPDLLLDRGDLVLEPLLVALAAAPCTSAISRAVQGRLPAANRQRDRGLVRRMPCRSLLAGRRGPGRAAGLLRGDLRGGLPRGGLLRRGLAGGGAFADGLLGGRLLRRGLLAVVFFAAAFFGPRPASPGSCSPGSCSPEPAFRWPSSSGPGRPLRTSWTSTSWPSSSTRTSW